jgi:hypothetical protein
VSVPADLYRRVFDLATALTNASESSDQLEYADRLSELKALFEERARLGNSHPFLTETLADYTEDLPEAIELYRLALTQCSDAPGEPTHTKHLSLAERLIESGALEDARKHLAQGREAARRANDTEAIDYAAQLARTTIA